MFPVALLALVSLAQAAEPAKRAEPIGNLAQYFGPDDYPRQAALARTEGVVRFQVEIGRDGRVTGCHVTSPSGSSVLDETTCRIASARLRFSPARDASGSPTTDHFTSQVRWQAPAAPPPGTDRPNLAQMVTSDDYPREALRRGEQGLVAFSLTVSDEGVPIHCEVTTSSGSRSLDERTCEIMLERPRFTPARDSAGNPVEWIIRNSISWRIAAGPTFTYEVDETPGPRRARPVVPVSAFITPDDYPMRSLWLHEQGRVGFELQVSAEGRVTDCRFTNRSASRMLDERTCEIMLARARFHPARNARNENIPDSYRGSVNWRIQP